MISEKRVEDAPHFLVESAEEMGELEKQARLAEHMVKHVEALQMKKWNEESVAAQNREARASQEFLKAITEDAVCCGEKRKLMARRQAAETTISVWQSMVKDRQGARP